MVSKAIPYIPENFLSVRERLRQLPIELDVERNQVIVQCHLNRYFYVNKVDGGEDFRSSSLERIAKIYDYIPVVFIHNSDMTPEDLGNRGFLYGEKVDNYVSRAFRRIRKKRGYFQEELGEITGIDGTYISRIESGKYKPTISTMEKVAKALEVTPAYLVKPLQSSDSIEQLLDSIDSRYPSVLPFEVALNMLLNLKGIPPQSVKSLADLAAILHYSKLISEVSAQVAEQYGSALSSPKP